MKTMKKMKVVLSMVLLVSLLFVACSKTTDDTPAATDSPADTTADATDDAATDVATDTVEAATKIVVFQSKVEIIDQLEALALEYEAETGVEVEVWGTTGDDYLQQLKVKLSNNQGPTVFSLQPGSESNDLGAYLADLSDVSFIDDVADGMTNVVDGQVSGIPYTVEGFGLVYNKSLINAAEVNDLDTFTTMLEDQKAAGIDGFSLSQESYFLIGHILNTPFALVDDPATYIDNLVSGAVTMNETPEFVDFANLMVSVRENTKNPLEVNYDSQTGDFATGKTASIHQGNWCYGMFADYDMDFEIGMMPLPIAGNDAIAVSVPTCWYVNSQATPEEIKAGKDFLEWLYTSDTGINYLMNEFGFIPVLKSMTSDNLDPLSQEIARFTAEGKTISWPMAYWPAGIVDVYLVPVAQEFFTTDMSAEDFLTKLTEAFVEAGK